MTTYGILLSILLASVTVDRVQEDSVTIAQNGVGRAVVVVAPDATEVERHAAVELVRFLGEATGATLPIVDHAEGEGSRILVGPDAARLAIPDFSADDYGDEELFIRTKGHDLILAGGRPRGTLYAVYTFLEDVVGCRWWTSTASTIPEWPILELGILNGGYAPRFEYRESFWFDAFDGDWAARNRGNGNSERLEARHGGKHVYQGFVHTFYPLIPPDEYFEAHPEWFAEIDGERVHHRTQLCLANEEMRRQLVENLKVRLRANPQATIASVSQNDWHGYCRCARCAAVDDEEGGPSGSLLRFVNAVAAEIEEEFPHVAISTLAYQYTRKPPRLVRPRSNVIVRLCSIECSFSKPLSHDRNAAFRDDLLGWSKVCDRLYVWDYTTNFAHYVLPHPNLRVLGPNIAFFAEHGVRGVFEQGAYQSPGAEMAELRAWVLAKLLWDPSRDPEALINEFLDGYYGPAAGGVRAYLGLIHDAVEASGDYLGCYSPPDAGFLSLGTLVTGILMLHIAEQAAGDDEILRHRVRVARLPVLYAFLVRWKELRREVPGDGNGYWLIADSIHTVYERFMAVATAEKITRVAEGRTIDWLGEIVDRK